MSLIIVMVTISSSLLLTYAFLRTQSHTVELSSSRQHRDLALEAARAGAAVGWQMLQSPEWGGVDQTLSQTHSQTTDGRSSYLVEYLSLPREYESRVERSPVLYVLMAVTGSYESSDGFSHASQRIEVLGELVPRLADASQGVDDPDDDRPANPADFDRLQRFALSTSRGRNSLILEPQARIDGDLLVERDIRLYEAPSWSNRVRRAVLDSIGQEYATDDLPAHPHPVSGRIFNVNDRSVSFPSDAARLGVEVFSGVTSFHEPSELGFDPSNYQVYRGGPSYSGERLSGTIRRRTLSPSSTNPLGFYYCTSDLRLANDVTVIGTLIVSGRLRITGRNVHLANYDWRGADGADLVGDRDNWPLMPAVFAEELQANRHSQLLIEGAVVTRDGFVGGGANQEWAESATVIDLAGVATAEPVEQPWTTIRVTSETSLATVATDGTHAIWIDQGNTGSWHVIHEVDVAEASLRVRGTLDIEGPFTFRVRPTRLYSVDIHGPLLGAQHEISRPSRWVLTGDLWNSLHDRWELEDRIRRLTDQPQVTFIGWLQDPGNYSGWGLPWEQTGMVLEPTFHLRNLNPRRIQWGSPLLAPGGAVSEQATVGYRWRVVDWREMP